MGYTHYWRNENNNPSEDIRKKIGLTLKTLYQNRDSLFVESPSVLVEEYDLPNSEPIFDENEIRFNGLSEMGHETFLIDWNALNDFEFCKTNRKPYDFWVISTLLIIKSEAPEALQISSDGDYEEWNSIKNQVVAALKRANINLRNLNQETEVKFSEDGNMTLQNTSLDDEIVFNSFFK